jgi:hypothetical protein
MSPTPLLSRASRKGARECVRRCAWQNCHCPVHLLWFRGSTKAVFTGGSIPFASACRRFVRSGALGTGCRRRGTAPGRTCLPGSRMPWLPCVRRAWGESDGAGLESVAEAMAPGTVTGPATARPEGHPAQLRACALVAFPRSPRWAVGSDAQGRLTGAAWQAGVGVSGAGVAVLRPTGPLRARAPRRARTGRANRQGQSRDAEAEATDRAVPTRNPAVRHRRHRLDAAGP